MKKFDITEAELAHLNEVYDQLHSRDILAISNDRETLHIHAKDVLKLLVLFNKLIDSLREQGVTIDYHGTNIKETPL